MDDIYSQFLQLSIFHQRGDAQNLGAEAGSFFDVTQSSLSSSLALSWLSLGLAMAGHGCFPWLFPRYHFRDSHINKYTTNIYE